MLKIKCILLLFLKNKIEFKIQICQKVFVVVSMENQLS
jgi:hypothetical protein